jgi:hypothetical protein
MGYLHIDNLYKNQKILEFKECFVLEKIHGTSAHISFKFEEKKVVFFAGGEPYNNFIKLFNEQELLVKFLENFTEDLIIFGEAYGGKQQAMKHVYGPDLKFVAFDVKLNNKWLPVPYAESICKSLGIEFVWYEKIATDLDLIHKIRDGYSVQANRNGMGDDKFGEGIILKTVNLYFDDRGERVIAKHKREEFRETKTKRPVTAEDIERFKILNVAKEIADEWVTEMRLEHILGKIPEAKYDISNTGEICSLMVEDVEREAAGEIVFDGEAEKAIKQKTAIMFKDKLRKNKQII